MPFLKRNVIHSVQVKLKMNNVCFSCISLDSVTKAVSDADRKRISDLERGEAELKNEVAKLREISEVATTQCRVLDSKQVSRDKEVMSLRQQLLDFQAQSDEKAIIGRLKNINC